VLFFGSDDFSLETLRIIHQRHSAGVGVVCPADSSKKPHGAVRQYAVEHGLTVHEIPIGTPHLRDFKPEPLLAGGYEIGVVASFGYFVPEHLLSMLTRGAINVHPSLLPKYRGASPIQSTLMNGDGECGVSIIEVHPGAWDLGDILSQIRVPVAPDDTYSSLHDRLAKLGGEMVLEALADIHTTREKSQLQVASEGSHAAKIKADTGRVRWTQLPAASVHNLWRAIGEAGELHTFVSLGEAACPQRVILREVVGEGAVEALVPQAWRNQAPPAGSFRYHKKSQLLLVRCNEGYVGVQALQVESKKAQRAVDFANGYRLREGTFLDLREVN